MQYEKQINFNKQVDIVMLILVRLDHKSGSSAFCLNTKQPAMTATLYNEWRHVDQA